MASIKLNKLTNNIVASDPKCSNNFKPILKKRFYFRKTNGSRSKVKLKCLFMLEHFKNGNFAFITLTTQQHKKLFGMTLTDSELMQQVGIFLRNKDFFGDYYVCVCERQRQTNDLHFHILTFYKNKSFVNYQKMKEAWAYRCGAVCHPALLQFDWVTNSNTQGVARYISKLSSYVSKESGNKESAYSSLFNCRTYSVSNKLSLEWKKNAHLYIKVVKPQFLYFCQHLIVNKFKTEFFTIYKLNNDIWELASSEWLSATPLIQSGAQSNLKMGNSILNKK